LDHLPKRDLAFYQRVAAKILAVRIKRIEGEEAGLASLEEQIVELRMT